MPIVTTPAGPDAYELQGDWTAMMRLVGVEADGDLGLGATDLNETLDTPTEIGLPGASGEEDLRFESWKMEHSIVPVFDDYARVVVHLEGVMWLGKAADASDAVLVFTRSGTDDWGLTSGLLLRPGGELWGLEGDTGTPRMRQIAERDGEIAIDPSTPSGADQAQRSGIHAAVNAGTKVIDFLAVGLNHAGDPSSTAQLVYSEALLGEGAFETATSNSSSANWIISGITATLRGVMTIEAGAISSADNDLTTIKANAAVTAARNAIGADAVAGMRKGKWSDYCGLSTKSTGHFVWQYDQDNCQDEHWFTFAHEMGHLVNANHDEAWTNPGSGSQTTLMGSSVLRILYFSNPDVYFPGTSGNRTGNTDHNNAKRIADDGGAVAGYDDYIAPSGGRYTPLNVPERVLNTTTGLGGLGTIGTTEVQISVLAPGVPLGAKAVAFNVVVISGTGDTGGVRMKATAGTTAGAHPVMLYKPNDTRAQTVVMNLGSYRTIYARTDTTVEMIIDVVGYFAASGSTMHTVYPSVRAVDQTINSGADRTVSLVGICDSNTTAAFVNLVAVYPTGAGYLQVRGDGSFANTYSTLNYSSGDVIANATFAEVKNRQFIVHALTQTQVIVDVFGCLSNTSGGKIFTAYSSPTLRATLTLGSGNIGYVDSPGAVTLSTLNVTSNSTATFLQAYEPSTTTPTTSSINLVASDYVSNLVLAPTATVIGAVKFAVRRPAHSSTTTFQAIQLGYFS